MAGYTRQDTANNIANGNVIDADDFDAEYNAIEGAFNPTTGHSHDGSAGEGAPITKVGPAQNLVVSGTSAIPSVTNTMDLGAETAAFKDAWFTGEVNSESLTVTNAATISGTLTTGSNVSIAGNLNVTGNATIEGNLTFGNAATDTVTFSADVSSNVLPETTGAYNLGSATQEWHDLHLDGTANVNSVVANTVDLNGGTIDGTIIGGSTAAAITGTTITANTGFVGNVTGTVSSLSNHTTSNLSEGINQYFTTSRARNSIGVSDAGGDGSLAYNATTGTITYTGPSATEVRAHLSVDDVNGDGSLAYNNTTGVFTYTGPSAAEVRAHLGEGEGINYDSGTGVISAELASTTNAGVASFNSTDFAVASGVVTLNKDPVVTLTGAVTGAGTMTNLGSVSIATTHTADPTITLSGDLSGSVTLTNLDSGTLNATINANSVALGTDTTGNYVGSLVAGTGVGITGNSGEGSTPTVSIGQAVGTTSNVTFNNVTASGDVSVTGDLTVAGTFTTTNTETISISSQYITVNDGQTGTPTLDGGIEIERGTSTNKFFKWDESNDRWTAGTDSLVAGTFIGNLSGNVTGDVTGDLTGDVTGTVSSLSNHNTGSLTEGTNLYHTTARARGAVSATDAGGYGSFTYNSGTGVFTYTGPSDADIRGRFSAGEGIDVSATGVISGEDASTTNKGIASFNSTDFSVSSGGVSLQAERIQDIVGAMVSGNTESGISVAYQDTDGTLDFNVNDPTITLTGAVTGSATMTNLGNVSIATTHTADPTITLAGDLSGSCTLTNLGSATLTATIQPNSVALGTDTTGNYVFSVSAGNGISVSSSSIYGTGEAAAAVISHADTNPASSINGTGNTFVQDLTFDGYGHVTGSSSVTVDTTVANIGHGQSVSTATFSDNAVQHNNTGRPIWFSFRTDYTGDSISISPNNSTWYTMGTGNASSGTRQMLTTIVPAGWYYKGDGMADTIKRIM